MSPATATSSVPDWKRALARGAVFGLPVALSLLLMARAAVATGGLSAGLLLAILFWIELRARERGAHLLASLTVASVASAGVMAIPIQVAYAEAAISTLSIGSALSAFERALSRLGATWSLQSAVVAGLCCGVVSYARLAATSRHERFSIAVMGTLVLFLALASFGLGGDFLCIAGPLSAVLLGYHALCDAVERRLLEPTQAGREESPGPARKATEDGSP